MILLRPPSPYPLHPSLAALMPRVQLASSVETPPPEDGPGRRPSLSLRSDLAWTLNSKRLITRDPYGMKSLGARF
ncbi:hypothetical protein E2542_SST24578 [Spatholobus suberectus]|nr:hypothetical protein E2542_SST24578 [Spatholobus suberectus]